MVFYQCGREFHLWRKDTTTMLSSYFASHDNIASNMGVIGAEQFETKCPTLVDEITRKFTDYIVGLHRSLNPDAFSTHTTALNFRSAQVLSFNEDGFPLLPERATDVPLLKVELEQILRAYMNAHYSEP